MEILDEICRKVKTNTEYNNHTEARILIASRFGYSDIEAVLRLILHQQNKAGNLSSDLQALRNGITDFMMEKIFAEHGILVHEKIYQSL